MASRTPSVFAPGLFAGQVVVVSGAAAGIGRRAAQELSMLGAHVVLIGGELAPLHDLAGDIVAHGGRVSFHACNAADETEVQDVVQAILVAHGRIHALVEAAPAAALLLARACCAQALQQHGGAIVLVGMPDAGGAPRDWLPAGVRLAGVAPGAEGSEAASAAAAVFLLSPAAALLDGAFLQLQGG